MVGFGRETGRTLGMVCIVLSTSFSSGAGHHVLAVRCVPVRYVDDQGSKKVADHGIEYPERDVGVGATAGCRA
jgi:hypothetical protein